MFPKISLFLLIFNLLIGMFFIIGPKKRPQASWAWFFMLFVLPIWSIFFYFIFGTDAKTFKSFLKKQQNDKVLNDKISEKHFKNSEIIDNLSTNHLQILNQSPITIHNQIKIYHHGQEKFDDLITDIKNAKKNISIQYYIMKNDQLGRRIINVLAEKAKQGITVNLLLDKMGSRRMSKKITRPLLQAGGNLSIFSGRFGSINYRNHRKICIIDGNIGYIGGFNIGNEYLEKTKQTIWRDCHLRIQGSAVNHLALRFIQDYNYSSKEKIKDIHQYIHKFDQTTENQTPIQIVSSGPDTEDNNILYAYVKMISMATKYIYIQTPYFIPHESIQDSLIVALKSGIEVAIMIPNKPDHICVKPAGESYLGQLIHHGAKCYAYTRGFVHSKLVIVDGQIASVGTANMDIRSLTINFEVNAFLYDEKKVKQLENQFMIDIAYSKVLDYNWYIGRKSTDKIKESLCRMISPLL